MIFPFKAFSPEVAVITLWFGGTCSPPVRASALVSAQHFLCFAAAPTLGHTVTFVSIISTNSKVTKVLEKWMEVEAKGKQEKNNFFLMYKIVYIGL